MMGRENSVGETTREDEDEIRCRYDDCVEAHPVVPEEDDGINTQWVTCPTCREDMGLPPIEDGG